jgi:elongation factor Tu
MKKELIMTINDVFNIIGRGTIALGRIENEKVEIGQMVIVDPEYLPEFSAEIRGIEALGKRLKIAKQNEYVGLQLGSVEKNRIKKKMKIYLA